VLYGVGVRLDERPELLFRLRAVDETELLSNLGSALPYTQTKRDTAHTLPDDDLAALFNLEMEESRGPARSHSAEGTSADRGKRPRTSVVENLSIAAALPAAAQVNALTLAQEKKVSSHKQGYRSTVKSSTKAAPAEVAQKHTMAPKQSAAEQTVTAETKSAAKSATKPSAEIRKPQAKAALSRRRSDSTPGVVAPVPVSQFSSGRSVRSFAAPKPTVSAKRRHGRDG
jgi:uncharacterized Zn finger protein